MANYLCEEKSSCANFQSAICLHCNLRLCLSHVAEHDKLIYSDVEDLSEELNATSQQLKETSEKTRTIFNDALSALEDWRRKQIERAEDIYRQQLETITVQRQFAEEFCQQLTQRLDQDVQQQLNQIRIQQNVSVGVLNLIRHTIQNIHNESTKLTDVFAALPKIGWERSSSSSIATDIRKESSTAATHSSNARATKSCLPFRRLVQMFSNLSSIEQSQNEIDQYIRSQGPNFSLPILVCSYLDAWYRKAKLNQKVLLLTKYVLIIQKYLAVRTSEYDILYGIQGFFYYIKSILSKKKRSNTSIFNKNQQGDVPAQEMMTFLLQFFVAHHCISGKFIRDWYHNRRSNPYRGFTTAKQLATPFMQSITSEQTGQDVRTVSISTTDAKRMKIKVEPSNEYAEEM
ncbi:unnamed protein product [Adineta ricciae]|uniref:Uncharacterized protein n=1 Tax=Adineta ricciae TaxID=249248 RepID=A0A814QJY5_ADIRI|nr:unnamed protein product [Adineta ricciae]